jgi:hypothetical protein
VLVSVLNNNPVKRMVTFAAFTPEAVRIRVTGALAGFSRLGEIEAWGRSP